MGNRVTDPAPFRYSMSPSVVRELAKTGVVATPEGLMTYRTPPDVYTVVVPADGVAGVPASSVSTIVAMIRVPSVSLRYRTHSTTRVESPWRVRVATP